MEVGGVVVGWDTGGPVDPLDGPTLKVVRRFTVKPTGEKPGFFRPLGRCSGTYRGGERLPVGP